VKNLGKALLVLWVLSIWSLPLAAESALEYAEGRIKISGRFRAAYNYQFNFADDEDHKENRFYIHQARLRFGGQLYEVFEYDVHLEFRSHDEAMEAKDIRVIYKPVSAFAVTVGQFKVPYSRQRVMSTTKLQFQTRPNVTDPFVPGRDIGLMIGLALPETRSQFYCGMFTGNGINVSRDDSEGKPLATARIEFQPLGALAKNEGDIERTAEPRFLIGGNLAYSEDADSASSNPQYLRTLPGIKRLYGADATLKYRGFFCTAEIHRAAFNLKAGGSFEAGGYVVQAGYYIPFLRLEPCLRYDEFDPSDLIPSNTEKTVTYGLNFLPHGHNMKLMLNYYQRLKMRSADSRGWKEDDIQLLWQVLF